MGRNQNNEMRPKRFLAKQYKISERKAQKFIERHRAEAIRMSSGGSELTFKAALCILYQRECC